MKDNFERALACVLAHEGGYTDHPSDPGGPTNWGITLADARRYWKLNASAADVRAMPLPVAKMIYRARYWNALRCDELPGGLDYAIFDYGVNSGVGRARRVLRRTLKRPASTSAFTDGDIAAARGADAKILVTAICAERRAFLRRLKTWSVFGRGWSRRVAEVERVALTMIDGGLATIAAAPRGAAKAVAAPVSPFGKAAVGVAAGAGAGISAAGFGGPTFLLAVGALCIVAVAGFAVWRWYQARRQSAVTTIGVDKKEDMHGLV